MLDETTLLMQKRWVRMGKGSPRFFFLKAPFGIVPLGGDIRYPPHTDNYHHEIELVVAMKSGGQNITFQKSLEFVFGYAVGLDMTRRDLQSDAKKRGRPWDLGKSFEDCAPISALCPAADYGHPKGGKISLTVNGDLRQRGDLSEMIWNVSELICHLSRYYELTSGDLIFTGTPSGVGSVQRGDMLVGSIEGLGELKAKIV